MSLTTDTSESIAVITAPPPGFNPGMLVSELAARAFCERNGLAEATTYFRVVSIDERMAHRDEDARRTALARCDVGMRFERLDGTDSLAGSRPLYWGDFLHMRQYLETISRIRARSGRGGSAEEILLLAGAKPELVAKAVSLGTTLLFNTASDLVDPAYGPQLAAFARGARAILVRDVVSAGQLADLTERPQDSFLGIDAAQLVTLLSDWRELFGPATRLGLEDERFGVAFFARGDHRARTLATILRRLASGIGVAFRWLPWGDEAAFPQLASLQRKLRLAPIGGVAPPLSTVIEAVARARVVVTDTYHLAVIAWAIGTPAVLVPGQPSSGERTVNAGHWRARLDKRFVFYAQHGLLEFFLGDAIFADGARLEPALESIAAAIADGGITAWHRDAVRRRALWAEQRVLAALRP